MSDIGFSMVQEQIKELRAEIERLREQVASLQASSGYEASIAQLEIEWLRQELNWYAKERDRLLLALESKP